MQSWTTIQIVQWLSLNCVLLLVEDSIFRRTFPSLPFSVPIPTPCLHNLITNYTSNVEAKHVVPVQVNNPRIETTRTVVKYCKSNCIPYPGFLLCCRFVFKFIAASHDKNTFAGKKVVVVAYLYSYLIVGNHNNVTETTTEQDRKNPTRINTDCQCHCRLGRSDMPDLITTCCCVIFPWFFNR